jgi:hypothetical protein
MNRLLLFILLFAFTRSTAQSVQLAISHVVNHTPMVLKRSMYTNAAGDTFNITVFKYYLSNFSLTDTKGRKVNAAPMYALVSEDSTTSKKILLEQLPEGKYTHLSFMIGVDSILNFSGAQDGALDPMYGMFWTWNSGYIMAKLEGTSPSSSLRGQVIQFHIGGYRAPHITQRKITLALPETIVIDAQHIPQIQLEADAAKWFDGPNKISFREIAGFMTPGFPADRIADNYQHMFSIKNIVH